MGGKECLQISLNNYPDPGRGVLYVTGCGSRTA